MKGREMRQSQLGPLGERANALWGSGPRGGRRANGMWGSGGELVKRLALLALAVGLVAVPMATAGSGTTSQAFMTSKLTNAVKSNPSSLYSVIVKGARGQSTSN